MKIMNIASGKAYQLDPDTRLTVERTNPFFNDYGEQTLPVSLPDSPYNRMLLDHPDRISRKDKIRLVDASIQDGEYFSVCRQAVLGVSPDESIDTSFYMNDGSFYSRLSDTYITDVFKDETVQGIHTVDQAIDWLSQLWLSGGDDKFACFEAVVKDDERFWTLNRLDHSGEAGAKLFYNAVDRVEVTDSSKDENKRPGGRVTHPEGNLYIPKGFYMTPFIKANYLLKRLFEHFGYTLKPNFFTETEQFTHMVLLNNVADTIVTGSIKVSQLVPKVTCKKILDLFRKKFCCEFVTNEVAKTATVVLMNELVDSYDKVDLSKYLVGKLKISYPDSYKQLLLKPGSTVGSENESSLDSLSLIHSQFPTAQYSKELGTFIREGYKFGRVTQKVKETVVDCSQPYFEGGERQTMDIEVPEAIPVPKGNDTLFIGDGQYMNSSLRFGNFTDNQVIDKEESKSSDDSMDLMLAFVFRYKSYTAGTVTNYASSGRGRRVSEPRTYERKGDYSLVYNGDDGIFERFYRKYDTLLRNSLHTVDANLLLSQHQKQTIRSIDKINIGGSDFLINSLKFSLGTKSEATESKLLTLQLYEPVEVAKKLDEIIPPLVSTGYKWEPRDSREQITKEEYDKSIYKDVGSPMIFPPQATAGDVGKPSFVRKIAIFIEAAHAPRPIHGDSWWLITCWLEAVAE